VTGSLSTEKHQPLLLLAITIKECWGWFSIKNHMPYTRWQILHSNLYYRGSQHEFKDKCDNQNRCVGFWNVYINLTIFSWSIIL
jgi:hypothetical protein